jgi:hypothetical protein
MYQQADQARSSVILIGGWSDRRGRVRGSLNAATSTVSTTALRSHAPTTRTPQTSSRQCVEAPPWRKGLRPRDGSWHGERLDGRLAGVEGCLPARLRRDARQARGQQ